MLISFSTLVLARGEVESSTLLSQSSSTDDDGIDDDGIDEDDDDGIDDDAESGFR